MHPTRPVLRALAFLALALVACDPTPIGATRRRDTGVYAPDAAYAMAPGGDCGPGLPPCPTGTLCQSQEGMMRCVADMPAASCGDCPAPGECRDGVCIQPAAEGSVCEFDPECGPLLCIGGRCTPDPRTPCTGVGCEGCASDADCPVGLGCFSGVCSPPADGGCIADAECPGGRICEAGMCVDRATCEVDDPDLSGAWEMTSVLRFREALPSGLSALLDAVEGPFRFLAGDGPCFDFGLPGLIEDAVCRLLEPTRDSLPPWIRGLLGAIADLNVVLSTWNVDERMDLTAGAVPDSYRGTHVWTRVRFVSRTTHLEVDPATLFDWRFEPDPFDATASCGVLNIARHEVDLSIGALIRWLVGAVITEATGGMYTDLGSAARAASDALCSALGDAARSIDPAISGVVASACRSEIGDAIDDAVRAIDEARVEVSPVTLRGWATIESDRRLRPGHWDGRLLGGDFTGDFDAWR